MVDLDATYSVKRWPGVAVRVVGYPQVWEPYTYLSEDEEGNEVERESDEGEWVDDVCSGMVHVVMVGDNYKHTVDSADLILLDELDYCSECGQIGCCHDGRDR